MEPSFIGSVIDEMIPVPDSASVAATRHLSEFSGLDAGASTGTCLWGVWTLIDRMRSAGETGSIVTLLFDSANLYGDSYYDDARLSAQGLDPAPYRRRIEQFFDGGRL